MSVDVKTAYDDTKPTETPMPRMGLRWSADGKLCSFDPESTKIWNATVAEMLDAARKFTP